MDDLKQKDELKALCEFFEKIDWKVRCMDEEQDGYDTDDYYTRQSLTRPLHGGKINAIQVKGVWKS